MRNLMGVINIGNEQDVLKELTVSRCPASVPFGGRYRLIDFVVSNMVNSGIQNIGIFTLDKYRSLMDHLGSGKEWDLDRKRDGLFIFPPTLLPFPFGFKGDVQNLQGHLNYFRKSAEEYVIITGSTMVYNFNYEKVLAFHIAKGADITVLYKEGALVEEDSLYNIIKVEGNGLVTKIDENSNLFTEESKVSMKTFIMKKSLFIEIIEKCFKEETFNFIKDGIIANIDNFKIYGYPFEGYLSIINSVTSYYNRSMELLKPEIWQDLFFKPERIFTKTKNEPPTKYKLDSQVQNSLLANGCVIEGTVINSILFRGVNVARGALIKDSIVMQRCTIGPGAVVEKCILDKEVRVLAEASIRGDKAAMVVGKRKVINNERN